jgi:hypothetical protein
MLTNFDIERIAKKLDLPIIGVYSKDELANVKRKIGSYYINMQDSDAGAGSHWVFAKIYSDDDRDNNSSDSDSDAKPNAIYFDSFGLGMPIEVSNFLKPFKPVYCNNRQIQAINTSQCGWYCLICDYYLEHAQHSKTYLEDYSKFISIFSDKLNKNLTILKALFKPL